MANRCEIKHSMFLQVQTSSLYWLVFAYLVSCEHLLRSMIEFSLRFVAHTKHRKQREHWFILIKSLIECTNWNRSLWEIVFVWTQAFHFCFSEVFQLSISYESFNLSITPINRRRRCLANGFIKVYTGFIGRTVWLSGTRVKWKCYLRSICRLLDFQYFSECTLWAYCCMWSLIRTLWWR